MSVSDPLIREIKEWTSKFLENYNINVPISDANINLQPFCACIEKIFTKGLAQQFNTLGIAKSVYPWSWLNKIKPLQQDSSAFNYTTSVDLIRNCKKVLTSTGNLRLLIRYCLVKKCLHIPILSLAQNGSFRILYHPTDGVLGDEILIQILLSVLLQYTKFTFKLDLSNSSFLDLSWILPKVHFLELVPCKFVGISVSFSNEKAIVMNVDSNSVAGENVSWGVISKQRNMLKIFGRKLFLIIFSIYFVVLRFKPLRRVLPFLGTKMCFLGFLFLTLGTYRNQVLTILFITILSTKLNVLQVLDHLQSKTR